MEVEGHKPINAQMTTRNVNTMISKMSFLDTEAADFRVFCMLSIQHFRLLMNIYKEGRL